jgi:hypothetical protein
VNRLAAVLLGVALLAGCGGGGPNADDVLKETASNLGKIHSGVLGMKLLVTPQGRGRPFGFELHGPFALRRAGLPVARISYTQIADGNRSTATLVSDGREAYVETAGGTRRPLDAAQEETLSQAGRQAAGAGGIGRIVVNRWLKHVDASDGGNGMDKVTAELDVREAVTGLLDAARLAGQNVPQLSQDDLKRVEDAVRSTSFVLYSGRQDRLLRRLQMSVDFGFDVQDDLRQALGDLVGAKVDFELRVDRPNGRA